MRVKETIDPKPKYRRKSTQDTFQDFKLSDGSEFLLSGRKIKPLKHNSKGYFIILGFSTRMLQQPRKRNRKKNHFNVGYNRKKWKGGIGSNFPSPSQFLKSLDIERQSFSLVYSLSPLSSLPGLAETSAKYCYKKALCSTHSLVSSITNVCWRFPFGHGQSNRRHPHFVRPPWREMNNGSHSSSERYQVAGGDTVSFNLI